MSPYIVGRRRSEPRFISCAVLLILVVKINFCSGFLFGEQITRHLSWDNHNNLSKFSVINQQCVASTIWTPVPSTVNNYCLQCVCTTTNVSFCKPILVQFSTICSGAVAVATVPPLINPRAPVPGVPAAVAPGVVAPLPVAPAPG